MDAHLLIYTLSGAGVVELVSDYVVCEEGKPISPESSRILVSIGLDMNFVTLSYERMCMYFGISLSCEE